MIRKRLPWLLVAVVMFAGLVGVLYPRAGSSAQPVLSGTVLKAVPSPNFRLRDQFGYRIDLGRFHGKAIVVTFLAASCTEVCPVTAETLRRTAAGLGPAAQRLALLVISTDPEGDTRSAVFRFSRQHGMLHRWYYLVGSRAQLEPVWRAYHLYVAPKNAPAALKNAHTSATYLIDAQGDQRVLMGGAPDPSMLDRDVRLLLKLPIASVAQSRMPAPEVGHPAPAISLAALHGGTLRLSSYRGKVVLLNFWATWCTPCRSEMPLLQQWSRELRDAGFVVLGVDVGEARGDIEPFVRRLHVTYPIGLDEHRVLSAQYEVGGLPSSLIIDRRGIVQSYKPGILDAAYLSRYVGVLLGPVGAAAGSPATEAGHQVAAHGAKGP